MEPAAVKSGDVRAAELVEQLRARWRQLKRSAPPAERYRWLQGGEAMLALSPRTRRDHLQSLARVQAEIRNRVCSLAWFVLCWEYGHRYAPHTPCTCEPCRRLRRWPSIYVGNSGESYECAIEQMDPWEAARLPSSPTGVTLSHLRVYGIHVERAHGFGRPRAKKRPQQKNKAET